GRGPPLVFFPPGTRARGLPLLTYRDRGGREIVYVARRWVPPPELFADAGRYQVREGDRLDIIAAQQFGDASLFWRIADAHRVLDPGELTMPVGRWLRITLPAGMPGPP